MPDWLARHGFAAESGPVPDASYPRFGADGGVLHFGDCRREYRLGLLQTPIGAIADRFGLRVTMLAGAVIYIVAFLVMAAAKRAVLLILSGALIGVALLCTASSLIMTACARAVSDKNRSRTLGIVSAAGSLGTLMISMTTQSSSHLRGGRSAP
jgi:hypothetical protein